ncbi:MAG: tRNA (adenosine(37)-N6)-threonylcarbamoyltransferase complex dimerization subunit type 1 TsaB [Eubacterium sp.]|nr:tRNA (adenosine(37)-N6)-threonylcarbamoyltransferase complex dimerization subunit type 1 TsaB [Eubacterium sp.]
MKILGIDSSGLVATVALLDQDILVGEYTIHNKKTHSQTLLPMIDTMLQMADVAVEELDALAVSAGPGSFTGLRIGASTAKGLAQGLNIPIVAVPSLEGLAYNLQGVDSLVVPMMDARRKQAYYGIYRVKEDCPEVLVDQTAGPIEEVIEKVNQLGQPCIFLGDGCPVFRQTIEEEVEVPFQWAADSVRYQKAASVAALGKLYLAQGKGMAAGDFAPVYLRLSQAERERMEKKK